MLRLTLQKLHAEGMVRNAYRIRRDREFQEALVGSRGSVAQDNAVRRREPAIGAPRNPAYRASKPVRVAPTESRVPAL